MLGIVEWHIHERFAEAHQDLPVLVPLTYIPECDPFDLEGLASMEYPQYDTVILSDLHLGSETSRAEEAIEVLRRLRFRRLILLGDIFCDLNFGRLKKHHWHFLSYIRKLSNPKRGVEVVWVEGNHVTVRRKPGAPADDTP